MDRSRVIDPPSHSKKRKLETIDPNERDPFFDAIDYDQLVIFSKDVKRNMQKAVKNNDVFTDEEAVNDTYDFLLEQHRGSSRYFAVPLFRFPKKERIKLYRAGVIMVCPKTRSGNWPDKIKKSAVLAIKRYNRIKVKDYRCTGIVHANRSFRERERVISYFIRFFAIADPDAKPEEFEAMIDDGVFGKGGTRCVKFCRIKP